MGSNNSDKKQNLSVCSPSENKLSAYALLILVIRVVTEAKFRKNKSIGLPVCSPKIFQQLLPLLHLR